MLKNEIWVSGGVLLLGVALGALWSPRSNSFGAKIREEGNRQPTKSSSQGSGYGASQGESRSATRSASGGFRRSGAFKELTIENLIASFSRLDSEDELNPMEFARYGAQLINMNEGEVLFLLSQLKGPFPEADEEVVEMAGAISMIAFARLCELNGPSAMALFQAGEFGTELDDEFVNMGMVSWLAADPEGAQGWLEGLISEGDGLLIDGADDVEFSGMVALLEDTELVEVYTRWMVNHNPDKMRENIENYQSELVRELLTEEFATELVEQASTKEEVLALLNEDKLSVSGELSKELFGKLMDLDREEAKAWTAEQEPSALRDDYLERISYMELQENPEQGASWYMSQTLSDTEGAEGKRLATVSAIWASKDLEASAAWLLEQPNTAARDGAEMTLGRSAAREGAWEAAFQWGGDISDSNIRSFAIEQLLRSGWDRRKEVLAPEAVEAANAAGYGENVDAFLEEKGVSSGD